MPLDFIFFLISQTLELSLLNGMYCDALKKKCESIEKGGVLVMLYCALCVHVISDLGYFSQDNSGDVA